MSRENVQRTPARYLRDIVRARDLIASCVDTPCSANGVHGGKKSLSCGCHR